MSPARDRPAAVPSPPVVSPATTVEIPGGLAADEAAYWRQYAPLAHGRGLLAEATAPGLVLLCRQAAAADRFWALIEAQGFVLERVTIDGAGQEHVQFCAHPLIPAWRALLARVEQLQARYGIAADGKVVEADRVDPESETARLARILAVT